MNLVARKLIVIGSVGAVLLLANAGAIAAWMQKVGLIPWARSLRSEFLTGTALTIIVVLLILLPSRAVWAIHVRRCGVCGCLLMRRREMLADLGELSAGVAHEFRNSLATILGYARMLGRRGDGGEEADAIEKEVHDLGKVVDDFLRFADPPRPVLVEVDL